ncbi:hypothetical protein LWI29_012812 [Acer saccharum]|uniref:Ubiquitin-like domain-containing protein n=1 Tax=Acer saccharum TaxID=4024 RepID=A0AA39W2D1_ACESA|nr:hypothetical protein LWI29_012812 [Acer saccharum]
MPSNEKTIELQVLKGDTIQKIKSIIQYKEGICPHDFEIYSSGRLLENHKTVASLNIQSNDTLHMISNRKDTRLISVQTPTKGVIEVEVRLIHSVLDVKKIIESMINIRSQRMKLFINGTEEQLDENSKTLACYDINEGDILTIQYLDVFQISVRTYTGNTITLDVTSSSTVDNVKKLLYGLMGIPVHRQTMMFEGRKLENSMTLASYSIDEESILYIY